MVSQFVVLDDKLLCQFYLDVAFHPGMWSQRCSDLKICHHKNAKMQKAINDEDDEC